MAQRRSCSNSRRAKGDRTVRIKRGVPFLCFVSGVFRHPRHVLVHQPSFGECLRRQEVRLIVLTKRTFYPFINRSTQTSMTPKTIAAWSSVSTVRWCWTTATMYQSLCIVKVLTVQVVLCIPTAVEALTAILLTPMYRVTDFTRDLKYRLCAKVHLVQIVK